MVGACNNILKKIDEEKEIEEMQKQWHEQNRLEVRQKFI